MVGPGVRAYLPPNAWACTHHHVPGAWELAEPAVSFLLPGFSSAVSAAPALVAPYWLSGDVVAIGVTAASP